MIDDLKFIHERDPDDSLGIAERQYDQLKHQFDLDLAIDPSAIKSIVYSGMGGSALAALVSLSWPGYTLPFEVVRNYDIPDYVSNNTLFIACSYSGNTEETISSLSQAADRGAIICVIAGGGKLAEIAKEKGYPYLCLPNAEQPRYAILYNLKALLTILVKAGFLDARDVENQLNEATQFLSTMPERWRATVLSENNLAKQIAKESVGKSAVIYAGPLLAPAAYKWKINFNENAKQIAWWNQYPEFNHNEFIGWSEQPPIKPYVVIDLRSNLEHPRIQKRFELSTKLLSGKRPDPIVINAEGKNILEQLLYTIMLGDFVTIYCALLNGVNPEPVELVEKFKKELGQ
ncbi:MAG: bifunctional phosphoglucose/phosphomannose isomerase [Candidatus Saccharimonadales bacterium]